MEGLTINLVDVTVIVVIVLSGVFALVRGMVHEVLSVAAWVGAAFATFYGFPLIQPYARGIIPLPLLADIVAGVAIFVIVLILLSIVTNLISRRVRDSTLGPLDRSLGLVFGLLRGVLLVCLAWLLIVWIAPPKEQPPWLATALTEARSRPLIERGAAMLGSLISAKGDAAAEAEKARRRAERERQTEQSFRDLLAPKPDGAAEKATPGYREGEREQLDRLIESAQ